MKAMLLYKQIPSKETFSKKNSLDTKGEIIKKNKNKKSNKVKNLTDQTLANARKN